MFKLTSQQERVVLGSSKRVVMAYEILEYASRQPSVTCDDCIAALQLPHQSASPRFHELVKFGCLLPTNEKRKTRSGSSAKAYRVSKSADFWAFFQARDLSKATPKTSDQRVLTQCRQFVTSWKLAKSPKGRQNALVALGAAILKEAEGTPE